MSCCKMKSACVYDDCGLWVVFNFYLIINMPESIRGNLFLWLLVTLRITVCISGILRGGAEKHVSSHSGAMLLVKSKSSNACHLLFARTISMVRALLRPESNVKPSAPLGVRLLTLSRAERLLGHQRNLNCSGNPCNLLMAWLWLHEGVLGIEI